MRDGFIGIMCVLLAIDVWNRAADSTENIRVYWASLSFNAVLLLWGIYSLLLGIS